MSWMVVHDIHVIPEDDTLPHQESRDCFCDPDITEDRADDGSPFWLIIHQAIDERED